MKQKLYIKEPGDAGKIVPTDIAQGQLGDCFFLSSLGEISLKDPSFISDDIISRNGNGTETVHLYNDGEGNPIDTDTRNPTEFSAVSFHIANKFPKAAVNDDNTRDIVHGVKEIWPQVVEKAYAKDIGGYGVLNQGGYDEDAMEALTGHRAFYENSSAVSLTQLEGFADSSTALVTFDTPEHGGLPYKLVSNHAYMFDGLSNVGGVEYVHLLNPWGFREPGLIPVSSIGQIFSDITHGTV